MKEWMCDWNQNASRDKQTVCALHTTQRVKHLAGNASSHVSQFLIIISPLGGADGVPGVLGFFFFLCATTRRS